MAPEAGRVRHDLGDHRSRGGQLAVEDTDNQTVTIRARRGQALLHITCPRGTFVENREAEEPVTKRVI